MLSNEPTFPTKGYLLNLEETKCYDYEGKPVTTSGLSQASDGKIIIETNATKYCDLYFAKDDDVPVVTSFSITGKDASGADLTNGYTYNNEVTYKVEWLDTDVTHYCLTTNATSCDQTWVETGGLQSITVKNNTFTSTDGAHTIYVYLKDKAQNVSSTTDISKKTITVDRTAPGVPTFSIMGKTTGGSNLNEDYSQVVGVGVTLTLGSDIKDYCITTNATCSSTEWKSATTTPSITLPSSEGEKTYNAFVRDNANNVSGKATDSIFLDLTNPSVSKVTYKSKDTSSITVKVEGTDGNTGSGIVKYECKATTQSTWYQQDTNGNCKVTGLNDNTSYTIEGRVTDASGRVSTNSVSTTQSTEAAYSCSIGTRVYDATKGSSSGGYICNASASSQGWYNTTTYYTCSFNSSQKYNSRSSAENACEGEPQECSNIEIEDDFYYVGAFFEYYPIYDTLGEEERILRSEGRFERRAYNENGEDYDCLTMKGIRKCTESYWNSDDYVASYALKSTGYFGYGYLCELTGERWIHSKNNCTASCKKSGSVSSNSERSYYCPSGWSTYSGSGNSLECYKAATKG